MKILSNPLVKVALAVAVGYALYELVIKRMMNNKAGADGFFYRTDDSFRSIKAGGSGKMQCQCARKKGGYQLVSCRKSQHEDCHSCCQHYGLESHNEPNP